MKSKLIKSILFFGIISQVITSCNKNENIPLETKTSRIDISQSNGGGGVTRIVHTFYDGTSSEYPRFGCAGIATNCFSDFVVTGSSAENLNNIIPQLDGNASLIEVANIVSNNYNDLNLFVNSSTLDMTVNQNCNLKVKTDGILQYFIFTNLTNNSVFEVYPVQL